jgi:hypothetical protein
VAIYGILWHLWHFTAITAINKIIIFMDFVQEVFHKFPQEYVFELIVEYSHFGIFNVERRR